MLIPALDTKPDIGHARPGEEIMLLKEMFSPLGGKKEEDGTDEIDWLDDLKFFMDNNNDMLNRYFFPAVDKHKSHVGNPNTYKLYYRALERCLENYINKYNIENSEEKFPKESLIELAKKISEEQEGYIKNGDYDEDK